MSIHVMVYLELVFCDTTQQTYYMFKFSSPYNIVTLLKILLTHMLWGSWNLTPPYGFSMFNPET
jgi:hypothetical protein